MFITDVEYFGSDYFPKKAWSLLKILRSCVHFVGRTEEGHKIARKIRREFHMTQSALPYLLHFSFAGLWKMDSCIGPTLFLTSVSLSF